MPSTEELKRQMIEKEQEQKIAKEKHEKAKKLEHKLKTLIYNERFLLGKKRKIGEFKEPVMFLIRGGKVDFYENVGEGDWKVPDDSKNRVITLDGAPLKFNYGQHEFRGYICNIDEAFPLPQRPIVYSELIRYVIEKVMINYEKMKKDEASNTRKMLWTIAGIVIVGAFVYFWFIAPKTKPPIEAISNATQIIAQNISNVKPTIIG